ncbi:MAG TPA: hypothetical protein DCK98_14385 [Chloroflexi bacterium]|jgi:uncharacterized protein YlxW (UPF0749 family)|nr:hypothetical protein [Chloroflexota bacterium]HAL28746.1 hypothetical protein [Chloroflexota bacterium]
MRSNAGGIAATAIALFLGILVVTQFRSQDVYSRSLQLETPASLTTLIANLSDRNNSLRDEIFDLRLRVAGARDSVSNGQGSLTESQREIDQLRVFAAVSPARGQGISVTIDGTFDDRAMSDLTNELRNAGAEAISVNDVRVSPHSWYGPGPERAILLDGKQLNGPWTVKAIGASDVMQVAITRTGGIEGQFELIYPKTRFTVTKETTLDLPAVAVQR